MAFSLPIHDVLDALKTQLSQRQAVVLEAPPGAGKTTVVPLALLDQSWLQGKRIIVLEPRRLAAKAAAYRMADTLGEAVGQTVGYRVRFESQISAATRIEVVTEGILARRIQNDPALEGVGLVIFDEFHERHIHTDWGLALCMDIMDSLREDLKLLVMSATLDGEGVAKLLSDAPRITSEGKCYPVTVNHLAPAVGAKIVDATGDIILKALRETTGDILAFLPGAGEIRACADLLSSRVGQEIVVHPLYGDLPRERQQKALQPDSDGRRKIILSTPIAESSLTIDGVRVVVDSGYSNVPMFDPNTGLSQLKRTRISQASATQRAGRAGRQAAGVCYRLWSEFEHRQLNAFAEPEICSIDLAPLLLDIALWGVRDPQALRWLTAPPVPHVAQARELLQQLGALDESSAITAIGKTMAAFSCHPRLARMLVYAKESHLQALAADIAALLSERDLLAGDNQSGWDICMRLEALTAFRRQGREGARHYAANPDLCAWTEQSSKQWRDQLGVKQAVTQYEESNVATLLCYAYPDRIAQRRPNAPDRYLLNNGRGVKLSQRTTGTGADYMVCTNVDSGSEGMIRVAARLTLTTIEKHLAAKIITAECVEWDDQREALTAAMTKRLDALILESKPLQKIPRDKAKAILLAIIADRGCAYLPWSDAATEWRTRVMCMRLWQPDGGWPDLDDNALIDDAGEWLAPYLDGIFSRNALQRVDLLDALRARLTWDQQRKLDEHAPTHVALPGDRRVRLEYRVGEPPILAAKIQHLFGVRETPRVGGGKIAVVVHLLSPAMRPMQVTQDLAGFWARTYLDVKKDLKGRYPKHYWPDDPFAPQPKRER